ncbi:hypothetical protein OCAR_5448 [Afipia carboxidovorans OM5]|nr:hypothetical protein OCAR_5448 [Afipia carboxidovorans OM5]
MIRKTNRELDSSGNLSDRPSRYNVSRLFSGGFTGLFTLRPFRRLRAPPRTLYAGTNRIQLTGQIYVEL